MFKTLAVLFFFFEKGKLFVSGRLCNEPSRKACKLHWSPLEKSGGMKRELVRVRGMCRGKVNGKSKEVRGGNFFRGDRERAIEQVQNKQRKVWLNYWEGGVYIFSLWRGEKYRLLATMCLAGHKWRDLEIVGSLFRGGGDHGELIQCWGQLWVPHSELWRFVEIPYSAALKQTIQIRRPSLTKSSDS